MFNKEGQCVGIAFARYMDAEAVGYAIPPPIINHFLTDYKCDLSPLACIPHTPAGAASPPLAMSCPMGLGRCKDQD